MGSGSDAAFRRVPVDKPPFTISQLKKAIPPHCFHRSALRSFSYLLADLLLCTILFLFAIFVIPSISSTPLRLAAWPLYWYTQSVFFGAVWVIGHECGHHAFSESSLLDDIVGFILHSSLLVPYFSWKYSHRRHHSRVASLEGDAAFLPKRKSELSRFAKYLNTPLGTIYTIFYYSHIGWCLYLFFNYTSDFFHFPGHFDPYSSMFSRRERPYVFISNAGILAVSFLLYRLASTFSFCWLIRIYGVPFFLLYAGFVILTYLHHTHPALPHYDSDEWDHLRGSLSTVDRDYGVLLNTVVHHIGDTHVIHHLFSTIPHYHAVEAINSIKPLLGDYYLYDNTPFLRAVWREFRHCFYVHPDPPAAGETKKGVYWFTNKL